MKALLKLLILILLACFLHSPIYSQTTTKKPATQTHKKKSTAAKKPTSAVSTKEIPILLKSSCEKSLTIFAGSKANIKNPKLRTVGGLSKNTLYLKQNDVVCIMDKDKKPVSCMVIKSGISYLEIDFAGINISGR